MPKYYEYKIAGYYLYFTSYCVIECMHVHASDRKLTEAGSAKFFVKDNGDTVLQNRGILNDREIRKIQEFIKQNYQEMLMSDIIATPAFPLIADFCSRRFFIDIISFILSLLFFTYMSK